MRQPISFLHVSKGYADVGCNCGRPCVVPKPKNDRIGAIFLFSAGVEQYGYIGILHFIKVVPLAQD